MRHHSIRGVGIRYVLALILPVAGIVLVLVTVVQIVLANREGIEPAPRRIVRAGFGTPAIAPPFRPHPSATNAVPAPPAPPSPAGTSPSRPVLR